jgi:hypothetical protein
MPSRKNSHKKSGATVEPLIAFPNSTPASGVEEASGKVISRREAMQFVSVAAAAVALVESVACSRSPNPPANSIFDTCPLPPPASSPSTARDDRPTLSKLAVWIMLTTYNWDDCLKDSNFQAGLVKELGISQADLTALMKVAYPGGVTGVNLDPTFSGMAALWQQYITPPPPTINPYGGHPCPGGFTIRQIANHVKHS